MVEEGVPELDREILPELDDEKSEAVRVGVLLRVELSEPLLKLHTVAEALATPLGVKEAVGGVYDPPPITVVVTVAVPEGVTVMDCVLV